MHDYCQKCHKVCTKTHYNGAYEQRRFSVLGLQVCLDCFDDYDSKLKEATNKINKEFLGG